MCLLGLLWLLLLALEGCLDLCQALSLGLRDVEVDKHQADCQAARRVNGAEVGTGMRAGISMDIGMGWLNV